MDTLKIEIANSNSPRKWKPTTLEAFLEVVRITRKVIEELNVKDKNADDYKEEIALYNLKAGRIISTPVGDFRLAEGISCPKCGVKFVKGVHALSRRDNKTLICSDCGMREAIEDMQNGNK